MITEFLANPWVDEALFALLGFVLGFLIRGLRLRRRLEAARSEGAALARTSIDGGRSLQAEVDELVRERDRLERRVEVLTARASKPVNAAGHAVPSAMRQKAEGAPHPMGAGNEDAPADAVDMDEAGTEPLLLRNPVIDAASDEDAEQTADARSGDGARHSFFHHPHSGEVAGTHGHAAGPIEGADPAVLRKLQERIRHVPPSTEGASDCVPMDRNSVTGEDMPETGEASDDAPVLEAGTPSKNPQETAAEGSSPLPDGGDGAVDHALPGAEVPSHPEAEEKVDLVSASAPISGTSRRSGVHVLFPTLRPGNGGDETPNEPEDSSPGKSRRSGAS